MTKTPERPISLKVSSSPSHLAVVRGAVDAMCRSIGFDEECITRVVLSVDEALTNVIRHAYDGVEGQPIEIELDWTRSSDGLRISIRDCGRRVGREHIAPPPRDELQPGGLGLRIMTECMDRIEYSPAEGGGTVLTMVKRLAHARQKE